MFEKGEYVVYGQNGICKVGEITSLDMTGIDKEKQYYILYPLETKSSTIYCPIDNNKLVLRNVLSKDEAWALIDEIPDIDILWIANEKLRENEFKQAFRSGNPKELIKIIKTLYMRKEERIAAGKKMTATDEKYFHMAEDRLYSELALAIGKEKNEMQEVISSRINLLKK
ncbi:MAG: CarD family transcriptional regulator [Lachnospiraceae bacterium]|nr:CarD family transcriptional regulator [Lachnospiraceae bacterium]